MIVLLGYMGSGKSVVGQHLSDVLNCDFIDLDQMIENEERLTVPEIFKEKGTLYFRKKENFYLKEVIGKKRKIVLSLGGGTPCYYNHMELLNSIDYIRSFYLDGSIKTLSERLWLEKDSRPLISNIDNKENLTEFVAKHLFERRTYYNMADFKININDRNIRQVSEDIVGSLF